jgi:hypothetical protein
MTRSSGECSACPFLLDVLSELDKSPCFFVELGLHLAELIKLCVLTPPQGLGPQLAPAGLNARSRHRGIVILRHAEVVVFVVIPLIDVETLATWVVTFVAKAMVIVGAAREAVVTCGHEFSHGTGITKSGEIPTEVGVVVFLGTRWSGG